MPVRAEFFCCFAAFKFCAELKGLCLPLHSENRFASEGVANLVLIKDN